MVQHTAGPQLLPVPEQTKSGGRCQCPALREVYITYLHSGGKKILESKFDRMVFAVLLSWKALCSLHVEEIFMHSVVLMRPMEPGRDPLTIHIASLGVGHVALVRNCSVSTHCPVQREASGSLKIPSVLKTAQVLKPSSECHSRRGYSP